MEKVFIQANRKYRLDKINKVKEWMNQSKDIKNWEIVFNVAVMSMALLYFFIHFLIYLFR